MERLDKPEAKGILAFLGSTPPKPAEDAEKERKDRESFIGSLVAQKDDLLLRSRCLN